jgi:hypothetical protein
MRYTSRLAAAAAASNIARAALDADDRRSRLLRCHALLSQLDPDRPPVATQAREFRWQYRALRERVQLYAERLTVVEAAYRSYDGALQKAEAAIELSLQYFCDVLDTGRDLDDDGDADA